MDTAGVETVDFNALGGADTVTVNDLTGTDVTTSTSTSPAPSAAATATASPTKSSSTPPTATTRSTSAETRGAVKVSGLAPTVGILHPEARDDRLEVNTLAGTDTVDSDGLAAGAIQLFVDGVPVP